jgi:hypothetical protein
MIMSSILIKTYQLKIIQNSLVEILSCILSILFIPYGYSQLYTRGEDPGYLKWKQIKSDHFKMIYPSEFSSEAKRMTNLLEYYYEPNSSYLNHHPRKIPVILHNHSVYSNGFVAVAPRRMELVTTPASDSYSQEHFEQLVLHEFRHVMQVDKLNQGITRVASYIIGDQALGLVAGTMPFWYLEGDAVDAETQLSKSGRGRLPSFEKDIKAILFEKDQMYSYEKSYYGSFRDYVPSHYNYGYQMVAHARNKYGTDIWSKMVDYAAQKPYLLYPFYFGLKKYTGLSKSGLYKETIQTLKNHWAEQAVSRPISDFRIINRRTTKHYTQYRFPEYLNDSVIFAEKSGIDQIDQFILIDTEGNEKIIHTPGFIDPVKISLSGNLVAWNELKSNARWENESYSVVKTYNLKTGKEKLITRRSRYFAPDLSPDAQKISVIEISLLNEYALVILDSESGQIISRVPSPGNEFLQYPVWSTDGNKIFVTSLGSEGKCIKSFDPVTGIWDIIFHAGFEDITELTTGEKYLLFRGTFSGIDEIYCLDLTTGECFRVTSSRFGTYYPQLSANNDKILYCNYTSQGFDIVETPFNKTTWMLLDSAVNHSEQLYRPIENEEEKMQFQASEPVADYPEKKYHKAGNLFKIHSWAPFYFDYENPDIENLQVSPGITLLSQNLLSNAYTTLAYEYRDQDHYIHASFVYRGFYPVFRFSYDFGGLPYVADPPEGNEKPEWVYTNMNWNLKMYLPLNLTSNKYVRGLQPSIESRFTRSYLWYDPPGEYKTGLTFLDYRLYAYNYLKTSKRDILPRWGQVIDIDYVHAPFNPDQVGSEVTLKGTLYIPGFLRHNTIRLGAGFLNQKTEKYILNNLISMPRGYNSERSEQFIKLTADYVFPIMYPDLNIWHFLYIKRFKAAVFYDHGLGKNVYVQTEEGDVKKDLKFRSCGFELTSDFNFIHILFPFDMGIRFSYPLDDADPKVEMLFSIDISPF